MTTTDTDALTERIAVALYGNAEYYGPEDVQPEWERRDDDEQDEWRQIAAAVLPIVAEEVRKAKAEALREAANDPALRLSGHSGISITRLRARAAAQGPTDAAREAL